MWWWFSSAIIAWYCARFIWMRRRAQHLRLQHQRFCGSYPTLGSWLNDLQWKHREYFFTEDSHPWLVINFRPVPTIWHFVKHVRSLHFQQLSSMNRGNTKAICDDPKQMTISNLHCHSVVSNSKSNWDEYAAIAGFLVIDLHRRDRLLWTVLTSFGVALQSPRVHQRHISSSQGRTS